MRFAWLRQDAANDDLVKQEITHPLTLIRVTYNLVFWVFLLPFFTAMAYSSGFILFAIIIFVRLVVNLYTNNVLDLSPEQFESFPLITP